MKLNTRSVESAEAVERVEAAAAPLHAAAAERAEAVARAEAAERAETAVSAEALGGAEGFEDTIAVEPVEAVETVAEVTSRTMSEGGSYGVHSSGDETYVGWMEFPRAYRETDVFREATTGRIRPKAALTLEDIIKLERISQPNLPLVEKLITSAQIDPEGRVLRTSKPKPQRQKRRPGQKS